MLILILRTDNPEAEVGLFDGQQQLAYETWHAHRELSTTLHIKIRDMLAAQDKTLEDLQGIMCFQGPGSFTGLRIGLTVANAMNHGLQLPIITSMGDDWAQAGIARLLAGEDDRIALPHYGAPVHITPPRR